MLRRWPSKSNGVLPSRGSQDGGAEAYPVRRGFSIDRARLADEWGLVRERFGPVHDFTFGVATGRPASGETSDGRAVRPPHCWTGGASCEVVGRPLRGQEFPPVRPLPTSRVGPPSPGRLAISPSGGLHEELTTATVGGGSSIRLG